MQAVLNTASSAISFNNRLEDQAAKFYEELARDTKYAEGRKTFLDFAKENKKHKEDVVRTYRYIITDKIEAGFAFQGLNEADYKIDTELTADTSYPDVLRKAIKVEEKTQKFCADAAETSRGLLADISYAFLKVAKKKGKRKLILKSLLQKAIASH